MFLLLIIALFLVILLFSLARKVNVSKKNNTKCREQTQAEVDIEAVELSKMTKTKNINYSCDVAGLQYHDLYKCFKTLEINSKVELIHECNNPVDYFAVAVYYKHNMLGYVPATECARIAVRLKRDIIFEAHVESLYKNPNNGFCSLRVRIKEIGKELGKIE